MSYFYTCNVVVGKLSTYAASNVSVIDSFMLVWGQLFGGLIIRYYGRYKWIVAIGSGIQVLSFGLLYCFRDASKHLGGMIVSLVLYGIGGGMFTILQTGCQAAVGHESKCKDPSYSHLVYKVIYIFIVFNAVNSRNSVV